MFGVQLCRSRCVPIPDQIGWEEKLYEDCLPSISRKYFRVLMTENVHFGEGAGPNKNKQIYNFLVLYRWRRRI